MIIIISKGIFQPWVRRSSLLEILASEPKVWDGKVSVHCSFFGLTVLFHVYFSPIKKKSSKKRKIAISDDEDDDNEPEDKNNDSFEAVPFGDDDQNMSDGVSIFDVTITFPYSTSNISI